MILCAHYGASSKGVRDAPLERIDRPFDRVPGDSRDAERERAENQEPPWLRQRTAVHTNACEQVAGKPVYEIDAVADATGVDHRRRGQDPARETAKSIRRAHHEFIEHWEREDAASDLPPLTARTLLVADWLALLRLDPRLPRQYLDVDWPADRSSELFTRRHREFAFPAVRDFAALVG